MNREVPLRIKFLIFTIFFIGLAGFAFVIVDAGWTLLLLGPAEPNTVKPSNRLSTQKPPVTQPPVDRVVSSTAVPPVTQTSAQNPVPRPDSASVLDSAKQSVVKVVGSGCGDRDAGNGMGFIIRPGYVITNDHTVRTCGNIEVVDYTGKRHRGSVGAMGDRSNDLAILKISDTSLPGLRLARHEEGRPNERIQAVSYQAVPSGQSVPPPISEGVLLRYDTNDNLFYSQGIETTGANSGSPVFLLSSGEVIGTVLSKGKAQGSQGKIIPSKNLETFFRKNTREVSP